MEFEEQFPSIKCEQCNCEDTSTEDLHIHISTIQKHCLDKQKTIHINKDEMHELIVKGRTTITNGLKLDASVESDWGSLQFIKSEHMLLEEYKQRVRDAIENHLICNKDYNKNEEHLSNCDKCDLKNELGL